MKTIGSFFGRKQLTSRHRGRDPGKWRGLRLHSSGPLVHVPDSGLQLAHPPDVPTIDAVRGRVDYGVRYRCQRPEGPAVVVETRCRDCAFLCSQSRRVAATAFARSFGLTSPPAGRENTGSGVPTIVVLCAIERRHVPRLRMSRSRLPVDNVRP